MKYMCNQLKYISIYYYDCETINFVCCLFLVKKQVLQKSVRRFIYFIAFFISCHNFITLRGKKYFTSVLGLLPNAAETRL